MSELQPGFKSPVTNNTYSVLRNPVELGWDIYVNAERAGRLALIETMDIAPLTGPEDLPRAA
jgi:hypothetical protein